MKANMSKPYTILSVVGRMGREIYYDQNVFEGTKQEVFNKAINATDDNKYSRLSKILKKAVNDGLESQTQTH
jgi:hypothetical protein